MADCVRNPKTNWTTSRYLNKNATENERYLFQQWWDELINRYGTRLEYFTYNYSLSTHDYLYGEEPTASYSAPINVIAMVDIASESMILSKFGLQTDADITIIITVEDFRNAFGTTREPQSQDVIRLTEAGWDTTELPPSGDVLTLLCNNKDPENDATIFYTVSNKSWVRCPQLYEITERHWQDFTLQTNTLMGHYIWVLKGKRFDYSYQPGIEQECYEGDVGEETRTGILSGGTQDQSPDKDYDQNVEDDSNDNIWDYDDKGTPDSVYGEY